MEPKLVPARLRDHDGLTFPMLPTLSMRVVKRKRGQYMMLSLVMVLWLCLIHFAKYRGSNVRQKWQNLNFMFIRGCCKSLNMLEYESECH